MQYAPYIRLVEGRLQVLQTPTLHIWLQTETSSRSRSRFA